MSEMTQGIAILKKDAIDDGLTAQIITTLASHDCLEIRGASPVELDINDAYAIYKPEFQESDSSERKILMAMGIKAMVGMNLYLRLEVSTVQPNDILEAMKILNAIKGKATDDPTMGTIRGIYKTSVPREVGRSVYQYGPYVVRNRIHIPDTKESYDACRTVLENKVNTL